DSIITGEDGLDYVNFWGAYYDWDFTREGDDLLIAGVQDDSYDWTGGSARIPDHFNGSALSYYSVAAGWESNIFYGDDYGITTVYTTAGNTGFDQGGSTELIVGGDGDEILQGYGGHLDYIYGGAGNDVVYGGFQDDGQGGNAPGSGR